MTRLVIGGVMAYALTTAALCWTTVKQGRESTYLRAALAVVWPVAAAVVALVSIAIAIGLTPLVYIYRQAAGAWTRKEG